MAEDLDDPPSLEDGRKWPGINTTRISEPKHSQELRETVQTEPRQNFIVALAARPKGYKPGQGPPLQPLRLAHTIDSTAYIADRILLPSPGLAADGRPLPKRMTYLIGWRDMPAASLLVPAMQVLDYVSPGVLEDWEDKLEAELDDERARMEEEKNQPQPSGKLKEKARPPADHTNIVPAVAVEAESDNDVRLKGGAMSLSTPQKRKREDFEGLSGDESSPSNQIARELFEEGRTKTFEESRSTSSRDDMSWGMADEGSEPIIVLPTHQDTAVVTTEQISTIAPSTVEDSSPEPIRTEEHMALLAAKPGPDDHLDQPSRGPSSGTDSSVAAAPKIAGFKPFNHRNIGTSGSKQVVEARELIAETKNSVQKKAAPQPARKSSAPKKAAKKRARTPPLKEVDENGEPSWEVERLEDTALYDVEGRGLVRYFKVRWAGDWPADQNPSWEPEDNLPERLVKNYRRRPKKRPSQAPLTTRPPQPPRPTLSLDKHYKSVTDAFIGDVDDEFTGARTPGTNQTQEIYHSEGTGYESELFLVGEGTLKNKKIPTALKAKSPWELSKFKA